MRIPKSHPRRESLRQRHLLLEGLGRGIVTEAGLIAHGRGEAFDYLLGERTVKEAEAAEKAAVAALLKAKSPVISVNGNLAALVPKEVVKLARALNAKLEVNLFYRKKGREARIADWLRKNGAERVYGVAKTHKLQGTGSDRAEVDGAIWNADVVLVSIEDGDRTEALKSMGKRVIAIDLNPLSRTAQKADITIVDNVTRAFPNMLRMVRGEVDARRFDNKKSLRRIERLMRSKL